MDIALGTLIRFGGIPTPPVVLATPEGRLRAVRRRTRHRCDPPEERNRRHRCEKGAPHRICGKGQRRRVPPAFLSSEPPVETTPPIGSTFSDMCPLCYPHATDAHSGASLRNAGPSAITRLHWNKTSSHAPREPPGCTGQSSHGAPQRGCANQSRHLAAHWSVAILTCADR
jgi:hypothetical protein